jgi:predicted regulator of Ras-like GTPase activity (Roadblock/LC7/MglB family)
MRHALDRAIYLIAAQVERETQKVSANEPINRFAAQIEPVRQEASAPSLSPRPASSEPAKQSGWLSSLLARASRDDEPPALPAAPEGPPKSFSRLAAPADTSRQSTRPSLGEKKREAPVVVSYSQRLNEMRSSTQAQAPSTFNSRIVPEKPKSRLDELNRALRKLLGDSAGVEASALISEDGLMIASALPQGMEEARVAGMTATLLNLGSRGAVELNRGGVQEIIVRGERGYAVLISAGRGALLLALTNESSKLGLVFFDMRETIRTIQKVL